MTNILVLGSLNMDLVVTVARLPEPGQTVIGDRLRRYPGGKGANQAVAAARLGGRVAMIGRAGVDDFGPALIENLRSNGVDASGVELDQGAATGAALIYVANDGENMIAVAPGANATVGPAEVQRTVARLRPRDWLVMQLEIPVTVVEQAAHVAHRAGVSVLLNAAPAERLGPGVLDHVDALVVNENEARALADQQPSPEAMASVLRALGPGMVVVTLGPAGSVFCDKTGVHRVEPFPAKSIDRTGAGDAFVGALAVGLATALPNESAVRFANAAGAAATSALGAQAALPRLVDLQRLFGLDLSSSER